MTTIPKRMPGSAGASGHADDCNCQICGSLWFVSQYGEEGLKNIGHFFKTGEMNGRDTNHS